MSALTTSASPAASPRPSSYNHLRPPQSRSPRPPTQEVSPPSPRTHAPGPSRTTSSYHTNLAHPSPKSSSKFRYVDAGTQYSPEGYPPTAFGGKTATLQAPASNKRKQASPYSPMATDVTPMPTMTAPSTSQATQDMGPYHEGNDKSTSHESGLSTISGSSVVSAVESHKRSRKDKRGLKVMPRKYETGDPKDLGVLIADMLMELIRLNDKIPLKDGKLTRFHSRAPPGISVHDYLNRLIQHATLSPPILLSMVYYIDRLCASYPAFTIGSLTVHRFLITAATVASKGLSDSFWTNPTYARIGGISTSELATLELDFLQRVHYRIVPKPETLVEYYNSLVLRSEAYTLEEENVERTDGSKDVDAMDQDPT